MTRAGAESAGRSSGPRYAQLLYTSFDPGDGRPGGWQVKQADGALSPAEAEALIAAIATRFDLEPALPEYPTPDQLRARPARLAHLPLADGAGPPGSGSGAAGSGGAAVWHTVDAGRDASGRPGNVFAHVVLDRRPLEAEPGGTARRPIELWRSAGWLRPWGAAEVAATRLGPVPGAGPGLDAAAVIDWLTADYDRQLVFRVLLDAVTGALDGGPAVLLLAADHESAARWIAAVGAFVSPGAARRLYFCTHDSPEQAPADADRGAHLIAVPRHRAAELRVGAPVIVIDEAESPSLGEPGIDHRVARGAVPAMVGSVLAEGVLSDEQLARAVLARQDGIAADLGDDGARPGWALAAAVLEEPGLAEFHREAAQTVADEAPAAAELRPWSRHLLDRADALARALTLPDALDRLRAQVARGRGPARLSAQVLALALADPGFGGEPGAGTAVELATVPLARAAALDGLDADLTAALDAARWAGGPDAARARLLVVGELLHRLTAPAAAAAALADRVAPAMAAYGPPDDGAALTWRTAAAVSTEVSAALLRPQLAAADPAALRGLPAAVAALLYPDGHGGIAEPANPTDDDLYLFPFAVLARLTADAGPVGAGPAAGPVAAGAGSSALVGRAGEYALSCPRLDDAQCAALIDELVARALPDTGTVVAWAGIEGRVPPRLREELVFVPDLEPAVVEQLARLTADPAIPRYASRGGWLRAAYRSVLRHDDLRSLLFSTEAFTKPDAVARLAILPDDLATMLVVGVVAGQLTGLDWAGQGRPLPAALAEYLPRVGAAAFERVTRLLLDGVLDQAPVAVRALVGGFDPRLLAAGLLDPWNDRWAGLALSRVAAAGAYRGPATPVALRDGAWPLIAAADAGTAENFFRWYPDAAAGWLADLQTPAPAPTPAGPEPSADRGWLRGFRNKREDHV